MSSEEFPSLQWCAAAAVGAAGEGTVDGALVAAAVPAAALEWPVVGKVVAPDVPDVAASLSGVAPHCAACESPKV